MLCGILFISKFFLYLIDRTSFRIIPIECDIGFTPAFIFLIARVTQWFLLMQTFHKKWIHGTVRHIHSIFYLSLSQLYGNFLMPISFVILISSKMIWWLFNIMRIELLTEIVLNAFDSKLLTKLQRLKMSHYFSGRNPLLNPFYLL